MFTYRRSRKTRETSLSTLSRQTDDTALTSQTLRAWGAWGTLRGLKGMKIEVTSCKKWLFIWYKHYSWCHFCPSPPRIYPLTPPKGSCVAVSPSLCYSSMLYWCPAFPFTPFGSLPSYWPPETSANPKSYTKERPSIRSPHLSFASRSAVGPFTLATNTWLSVTTETDRSADGDAHVLRRPSRFNICHP